MIIKKGLCRACDDGDLKVGLVTVKLEREGRRVHINGILGIACKNDLEFQELQFIYEGKTRDPERIPVVLRELERVWKLEPDLRLTQLIVAIVRPKESIPNFFYFEDDLLLEKIKEFGEEYEKKGSE